MGFGSIILAIPSAALSLFVSLRNTKSTLKSSLVKLCWLQEMKYNSKVPAPLRDSLRKDGFAVQSLVKSLWIFKPVASTQNTTFTCLSMNRTNNAAALQGHQLQKDRQGAKGQPLLQAAVPGSRCHHAQPTAPAALGLGSLWDSLGSPFTLLPAPQWHWESSNHFALIFTHEPVRGGKKWNIRQIKASN